MLLDPWLQSWKDGELRDPLWPQIVWAPSPPAGLATCQWEQQWSLWLYRHFPMLTRGGILAPLLSTALSRDHELHVGFLGCLQQHAAARVTPKRCLMSSKEGAGITLSVCLCCPLLSDMGWCRIIVQSAHTRALALKLVDLGSLFHA